MIPVVDIFEHSINLSISINIFTIQVYMRPIKLRPNFTKNWHLVNIVSIFLILLKPRLIALTSFCCALHKLGTESGKEIYDFDQHFLGDHIYNTKFISVQI